MMAKRVRSLLVAGAIFACIGLVLCGGVAQAQSITFDLSGYTLVGTQAVFGSQMAGAGTVTGVDWNLDYSSLNGSWTSELALELISPGAVANGSTPSNSPNSTDTGYVPNTPSAAGTAVWGTSPGPSWNLGIQPDHNLGWANSTLPASSAGTSAKFNGLSSGGSWSLNLFDSYFDGATGDQQQGTFAAGSFITVNYVPEPVVAPGILALLGLAGVRRRRG